MQRIYKQNCKQCGEYYEGFGKYFCSTKCYFLKPFSIDHKKRLSKSHLGKNHILSERGLKSFHEKVSGKNNHNWKGGKPKCFNCNKIVSSYKAKRCRKCIDTYYKIGENHPGWKGGTTSLAEKIRKSTKYINWRNSIFEKDNYICQKCDQKGGELNADHIKTFVRILKENLIVNLNDAYNCEELWDINNGRTLCKPCHIKTDTWGYQKNV